MSQVARIRRAGTRRMHELLTATGVDFRRDRRRFHDAPVAGERTADYHVLIAPRGGNIGDQAMVESFLENTSGPVRIVVRTAGDIRIPEAFVGRARFEVIAGLIYGDGESHQRGVAQYRALLQHAASVSIVGADIMDGAYNVRASARRAEAATLARELGIDARILGFSWNGSAIPGAKRALARASHAGTRLLLRDPISAARARADGLAGVTEVADTVFAARTSSTAVLEELFPGGAPPLAIVNASGLVGRSTDQVGEYRTVIRTFLDAGLTVVLLPHVIRVSADDLVACRAIWAAAADPRVLLIDRTLTPGEVRGLCSRASIVLTGRMHLAIQAMWNGVPAITLATQGKVEGLMQLVGLTRLCVEPGAGMADRILPLAVDILSRPDAFAAPLADRLPLMTALADANFAGLPAISERTR